MKKILLPTDFSENSWNAITYALRLFEKEECTFYILNTYTPAIFHIDYVAVTTAQFGLVDAMRKASEESLDTLMTKINNQFNNPNHTFSTISSFNTLALELEELQKGKLMDMIIMGTKGATGAKEILFGTNTVHTLKNAKCPVLAIPSDFEFESPIEILFPSDYKIDYKDNHIQPILDIADQYHARVNILNVRYGNELTELQVQNKQKLETYFKKIAHLFHDVHNQNIPEAITKFQMKAKINLLVMINNKHSFFENLFFKSTINHIGFHLNIPFLVIPSKK